VLLQAHRVDFDRFDVTKHANRRLCGRGRTESNGCAGCRQSEPARSCNEPAARRGHARTGQLALRRQDRDRVERHTVLTNAPGYWTGAGTIRIRALRKLMLVGHKHFLEQPLPYEMSVVPQVRLRLPSNLSAVMPMLLQGGALYPSRSTFRVRQPQPLMRTKFAKCVRRLGSSSLAEARQHRKNARGAAREPVLHV
jgi:hypothetical protein